MRATGLLFLVPAGEGRGDNGGSGPEHGGGGAPLPGGEGGCDSGGLDHGGEGGVLLPAGDGQALVVHGDGPEHGGGVAGLVQPCFLSTAWVTDLVLDFLVTLGVTVTDTEERETWQS